MTSVGSTTHQHGEQRRRTPARWVGRASLQAAPAVVGERGEESAGVARAPAALHQAAALEPVDEPGETAAGEQHGSGQLSIRAGARASCTSTS